MKRRGRRLLPSLAAMGLAAGLLPSAAETTPHPEGEVTAGLEWFADRDPNESAKFLEYRDVPNGFVVERILFSWQPRPRDFVDLAAVDPVQQDQRVGVQFGRRDIWKA